MRFGFRSAAASAVAVLVAAVVGPVTGAVAADIPSEGGYLQIVAHEDDDILFMNPDLTREYSGPSTTVYLTAGERSNTLPDGSVESACLYAQHREDGARAAHAVLAGVPDSWDVQRLPLGTGGYVEEDTLRGVPEPVRLVFFQLYQSGDPGVPGETSLDDLYSGPGPDSPRFKQTLGSRLPGDGSQCGSVANGGYGGQAYTHADLVASLTELMNRYSPNVILTQDPKVYSLGVGHGSDPTYDYRTDPLNFGDNSDHRGAARIAGEAATGYHGPSGNGHVLLRYYRDYNVRLRPENVDPGQARAKQKAFDAYVPHDSQLTPSTRTSWLNHYGMYPAREYPRWFNGTAWSAPDGNGLINAFAVVNGQASLWRETSSGAAWTGPLSPGTGSGSLAPYLTVVKDSAGLLHLFGIRLSDDQKSHHDEIVTLAQTSVGGGWGDWTSIGNPNSDAVGEMVGSPVVTANQSGALTVFVRNYYGGVCAITQLPGGGWPSSWSDLGGGWVQDGLAATAGSDGRIDLFAPTVTGKGGILHWRQSAPNGAFVRDTAFSAPDAAGPLSVAKNDDGREEIFYSQAGTGQTVTQYVQSDGTWTTTSAAMSGPVSVEGPSVLTGQDGRITLATRNGGGGLSVTSQTAKNTGFATTWQDLGSAVIGAPSLSADATGRLVVLALGADARLHARRQLTAGTDSPFGGWQTVGS
ncbi:PIG-L family deacetylase [Kitasatospora sp. NPDC056138]|uniref:PIG-L family deacetylase n=1 Tax=Kitasatospora sp. NPDC056138 TaxID=3345724 RepID=UPI0035D5EB07